MRNFNWSFSDGDVLQVVFVGALFLTDLDAKLFSVAECAQIIELVDDELNEFVQIFKFILGGRGAQSQFLGIFFCNLVDFAQLLKQWLVLR